MVTPLLVAASLIHIEAIASPEGGKVTAGNASIQQATGITTINQTTTAAAIDWTKFSVGKSDSVRFNQPSASAVTLNRVTGTENSQILGSLTANGQVFILNPNGVLFGKDAQVNVGGLVASTQRMNNADFMAGDYRLYGNGGGQVANHGAITVHEGGTIALIAPTVQNTGRLDAPMGSVLMAASDAVSIKMQDGSLLGYTLDKGSVQALVDNGGLIRAEAGHIILTARGLDSISKATVNHSGLIEAQSIGSKNGKVELLGDMQVGSIYLTGTIDASAPSGGNGGFVETSAAHVGLLDGHKVSTLAPWGRTGTWLIDPNDYTIAAVGGDMTGAQLASALATNNVAIQSSSGGHVGSGDINVNDPVDWSANTLTLTAARNVNINAVMTANNTSRLVINTGTANGGDGGVSGGNVNVGFAPGQGAGFAGRVDFPNRSGQGFLTINGQDYTVITNLGSPGSTNGSDLQGIQGNPFGIYALGGNIDASSTVNWNNGEGFTPIGGNGLPFFGTFDGLGHVVSGLTIHRSQPYLGLFGIAQIGSSVRNVGLEAFEINGPSMVGSLVGLNNGAVANAYVSGQITANYGDVGGLLARNDVFGNVSNVYATGSINITNGSWQPTGGLIGSSFGIVTNAYAAVSISSDGDVGGLIANGYARNSYYDVDRVTINGGHFLTPFGIYHGQFDSWMSGGRAPLNPASYLTTNGNGEYILGTPQDVRNALPFVYDAANNFAMTADIDLTGHAGLYIPQLWGSLDGGGHVVRNLDLREYQYNDNLGWIGRLGGTLGNLSVENAQVSGAESIGGLVGSNSGHISNTYVSGSISSIDGYAGGVVGYNSGNIADSNASAEVSAYAYAGGLAGYNQGVISRSYATGNVSGYTGVGGLVGRNDGGRITDAYATGEITGGGEWIGGLVGFNPYGVLTNVHATGTVTGGSAVGGLVGYSFGPVTNAYATGDVVGTGGGVGGLIGVNSDAISNVYSTGNVSGGGEVGGLVGTGFGVTVTNGYYNVDRVLVNGARLLTAYGIHDAQFQAWMSGGRVALRAADYLSSNSDGEYLISGPQDLQLALPFIYDVANNFRLTSDLDLSTNPGLYIPYLAGHLDGGNHVVSGLNLTNYPANSQRGFIGELSGTLNNIGVVDAQVTGSGEVGALTGYNLGHIENAYATGSVQGVGYNVGGLAGGNEGAIANAYAAVAVTGSAPGTGGLVGQNWGTVDHTYASGLVTSLGDGSGVGGLVGRINAGAVTNSFWDTESTHQSGSEGGVGMTTENMHLLANFSEASLANGNVDPHWSISRSGGETTAWRIYNGDTYPLLRSFMRPLTLNTVSDANQSYNGTQYSGGNGFDAPGADARLVSYGGTAQGARNAGDYSISVYSGQQGYDLIGEPHGTLRIQPASLTVAANSLTSVYGDSDPTLTFRLTQGGLMGGDTFSGQLTRAEGNSAGTYAIQLGTLSAGSNYVISFNNGTLTITRRPVTVAPNAQGKVYGDSDPSLGWHLTAGNLVGDDSLSGKLARAAGGHVGNYEIDQGSLGNDNYVITFVNGTFKITPRPITVTANAQAKVYGDSDPTLGWNLTGGNLVGDDSLSGKLGRAAGDHVGTYQLDQGSLGNDNYVITFINGTLRITPRPITVEADAKSKVYGSIDPALEWHLKNGNLVGADTLTGSIVRAGGEHAGSYAITQGSLANSDYSITFSNGNMAITPLPIIIGADGQSKTQGGADPALTWHIVDGHLVGTDKLSGTLLRAPGEETGNYSIAQGTLANADYEIRFVDGVLVILPSAEKTSADAIKAEALLERYQTATSALPPAISTHPGIRVDGDGIKMPPKYLSLSY